jgi:hypothetical protein
MASGIGNLGSRGFKTMASLGSKGLQSIGLKKKKSKPSIKEEDVPNEEVATDDMDDMEEVPED